MNQNNCVLVTKKLIDETLASAPQQGKRLLEPLKAFALQVGLPFNILEDKEIENDAEVHLHEDDLWLCLEGEVTFIYGGELVSPWVHKKPDGEDVPNEIKAKSIVGGTETVLKPGDWLWIPAGQPHQHICKNLARLAIIKIPKPIDIAAK